MLNLGTKMPILHKKKHSIQHIQKHTTKADTSIYKGQCTSVGYSPRSAGWSWRLELECCERKILLGWLELELVAGVV